MLMVMVVGVDVFMVISELWIKTITGILFVHHPKQYWLNSSQLKTRFMIKSCVNWWRDGRKRT